jgi:hypothetical protein
MAYYTRTGDPPGTWEGRGCAALGVSGTVQAEVAEWLYQEGVGPGGERIIRHATPKSGEDQAAAEAAAIARYKEKHPFRTGKAWSRPRGCTRSAVADCLDPEVAIRTAAALAGPVEGSGDMQFWLEKAVFAMAALMHAAALLDEDMSAVWRWSQRLGDPLKDVLTRPGASPELLTAAAEIQRDGKAADSIRMTMARSLAWVRVPSLRRTVSGKGIRPFDAAQWIRGNGTLYMINSGELSAAAPLFRAVIEKVHRDCVFVGSLTSFGRIPNPVLFALDEVTQTAAVPLADWLATSAGSGIQVCFVVHTPAQLRVRYGPDAATAIWALAGTKIVLGGNTDADMAEEISTLAGMYGGEMALPVVPVAYLRQLPESRALVLAMNRSPIAVKVRPVWRRASFRLRANPPAWMPLPQPSHCPRSSPEPKVRPHDRNPRHRSRRPGRPARRAEKDLGQARDDIETAKHELAERIDQIASSLTEHDPKGPPATCWPTLDAEAKKAAISLLAEWVNLMREWHPSYFEPLTDCWASHPEVVIELHNVMTEFTRIYRSKHPPLAEAMLLYDRWLPGMLRRCGQVMKNCGPAGCANYRNSIYAPWTNRY